MTPLRGADGAGLRDRAGQPRRRRLRRERQGRLARRGERAERGPHSERRDRRERTCRTTLGTPDAFVSEPAHAGLHDGRAHGGCASTSMLGGGTAEARRRRLGARASRRRRRPSASRTLAHSRTSRSSRATRRRRVIINSRTGTVVIGSHVRVTPGGRRARLARRDDHRARSVSQPNPFSQGQTATSRSSRDHQRRGSRATRSMFVFERRHRSQRDRARGEPGRRGARRPRRDPRGAARKPARCAPSSIVI